MKKNNKLKQLLLVALGLAMLAGTTPVRAADIFVAVTGVRNAHGSILACLWLSGWGFPNCEEGRDNVKQMKVPALEGTVTFTFSGVEEGTYAISVGHDQNNDGVLERHKFLKYPIEGAGISNYTEPPSFVPMHHSATFKTVGAVTEVQIPMLYPPE